MTATTIANQISYANSAASVHGKLTHQPYKERDTLENLQTFATWAHALAFLEGVKFSFDQLGFRTEYEQHDADRYTDANARLTVWSKRGRLIGSYDAMCYRSLTLKELEEDQWEGCI